MKKVMVVAVDTNIYLENFYKKMVLSEIKNKLYCNMLNKSKTKVFRYIQNKTPKVFGSFFELIWWLNMAAYVSGHDNNDKH